MQGYRNGYGKPRRLTLRSETVTERRTRVRDLDERFESRLVPLFTRRTQEVRDSLPDLYLHGLASGEFELALRGLLGEQAPLSASTVARAKERWQAEYSEWQQRRIEDEYRVPVVGRRVPESRPGEGSVIVAIGVKADGHKVVLAVTSGYRESTASWSALRNIFPGRGAALLESPPGEPVDAGAQAASGRSARTADEDPVSGQRAPSTAGEARVSEPVSGHGYERAPELIDENWEQMVTFYRFPRGHWRHLRTSNVIESPFAALRLRTDTAKRFKNVANATAVVWSWSPNASSGVSTRPSYCRPWPPGSSITTAYRSEEAITRRPPPDLLRGCCLDFA